MNSKEKILMFWSGGKDSALALHYLKQDPNLEVIGLITTINRDTNTVNYHGIPDSLLLEQAKMLMLPLQRIFLPGNCSDEEYIDHVGKILSIFGKRGVRKIAFGDIYLEDIKKFREDFLRPLEMEGVFPLWGKTSIQIFEEFVSTGHKALVTSVMKDKLDISFLNCEYDEKFIARLPEGIDPAGENGEFHTFVIYSPHFKTRIPFSKSVATDEGPYRVTQVKEP
jgi:uncharacterized protein (TIGR00290 family)